MAKLFRLGTVAMRYQFELKIHCLKVSNNSNVTGNSFRAIWTRGRHTSETSWSPDGALPSSTFDHASRHSHHHNPARRDSDPAPSHPLNTDLSSPTSTLSAPPHTPSFSSSSSPYHPTNLVGLPTMTLLATLYKDAQAGQFQSKMSQIKIYILSDREKKLGVIHLELARFVNVGPEGVDLELALVKCSDPGATISCTIRSAPCEGSGQEPRSLEEEARLAEEARERAAVVAAAAAAAAKAKAAGSGGVPTFSIDVDGDFDVSSRGSMSASAGVGSPTVTSRSARSPRSHRGEETVPGSREFGSGWVDSEDDESESVGQNADDIAALRRSLADAQMRISRLSQSLEDSRRVNVDLDDRVRRLEGTVMRLTNHLTSGRHSRSVSVSSSGSDAGTSKTNASTSSVAAAGGSPVSSRSPLQHVRTTSGGRRGSSGVAPTTLSASSLRTGSNEWIRSPSSRGSKVAGL